MVTVWWSQHGVIHYSFLRFSQAITADLYCAELRTILAKLAVKQPRLINRSSPLFLQYNARPHTALETVLTLQELQLETIRLAPYSADLAPTDYHFFRDLDNYLRDKKFSSQEAVQNSFTQSVQSTSSELYRKGINDLTIRWQQCTDKNSN
jgi:[histone H3]-lysine36 N-dimethyltransferase SETMAR